VTRIKQLIFDAVNLRHSARAQRWLKLSTSIFPIAIGGLLAWQLSRVGWREMCRSIPSSPLFYLLFLAQYVTLPGSDAFIFARIWRCGFWRLLPPAFLKHVYNQDVVELSGEAYFYVWSTKRLGRNPGQTLRTVKDISILSAVAGYMVTLALPPLWLWLGSLGPRQGLPPRETLLIGWVAPLVLCTIVAVAVGARRAIFFLPGATLLEVSGIHLARILIMNAVTVAQWMVVMPDEPWRAWWTLLAVSNLVGRLPSLFSNNLIFAAAGIEMSTGLELPTAAVAGMLLTNTALDKLLNLGMFVGTSLAGRYRPQPLETLAGAADPPPDETSRQSPAENCPRAA
jgi:hypothetical protein